ncbi:MAG TPA: MBL fold metallo-hydrolase [bacterium]|nr:MBL fold metallo-hydrolase [bacterium]
MTAFVASRRVGDAVVTVISEGTLVWTPRFSISDEERRRAMPDADAEGRVRLGLIATHLRVGDASIVLDPGLDDPASAWQREFAARWPGLTRSPGLAAALERIGERPDAVSHVVITHAHADHFAGVAAERTGGLLARFPHARHLIGRADWDGNPARRDPASEHATRLGLIERLGLLDPVDGEREIVPGVTLVPTPGETPGHLVVRLRSAGKEFYYLGDLFHHPCEVERIDWVPPNRDAAALRASRERLIADVAGRPTLLVFSHDQFPAWGRIVRAASGQRWERDA